MGAHIAPLPDSNNIRHKLLTAFHHAHKNLERAIVDRILDHPEKLGHSSYIEAVTNRSSNVRSKVTDCILWYVTATDQLKEVTEALADVFQ